MQRGNKMTDSAVFDKNKSLELKGIAIILMLFHHCFRLKKIYDGYVVSFYPFRETSIVNAHLDADLLVNY
jgi:hypothetical protein